jgi:pimeloyl-ACP methyl ester carboxylesterase
VLPKITKVPILFLSGLKDELVPYVLPEVDPTTILPKLISSSPSNMTQLFAVCKSETKLWRTLPNGGHNDSVAEPGYFEHIHSFVTEEVLSE